MSNILLSVLPVLGIIVSASYPDHVLNACRDQQGTLLPMPDSCSGFFMCHQGEVIARSCGDFYRFNAEKGFCDHPTNVVCSEVNPLVHYDQRPQIEDPNTYTDNIKFDEAIVRLPKLPLPKPIHPDEVNYDASAGSICVEQLDGVQLPKMYACEHYYVCIQQLPYRRTCAAGTHFNAALSECQIPSLAQCPWYHNKVETTTGEQPKSKPNLASLICVNAKDGSLVAHSADCGKFFYCDHASPLEMKCPKGLHFSAKHQVCVWPQQASCVKLYRKT